MKKTILKGLNITIGIFLIGFLVSKLNFEDLERVSKNVSFNWLLLSVVLFLLFILIQAYRWYYLLKSYKIPYHETLKLFCIGLFFNNFLPGGIGGDGYKVYYLNKIEKGLGKATILTLIDRVIGMLVMLGIILLFSISNRQKVSNLITFNIRVENSASILIPLTILLVIGLLMIYFLHRKYASKLVMFLKQCKEAFLQVSALELVFLSVLAFMAHCIKAVSYILLIVSLGGKCDFFSMIFSLAMIGWLVLLPISIGSLGIRESALTFLLKNFGVAEPIAIAFSLISRAFIYALALLGGVFFISAGKPTIPKNNSGA